MDTNELAALSTAVGTSSPVWGTLSAGLAYLVARSERGGGAATGP
jgi:hypothetical protein